MGATISHVLSSFQQDAEKEKMANDSLNALVKMAELQLDKFNLTVENNIGSSRLIPVNSIINQESIVQLTVTNEVSNVAKIIEDNFSAFASGDVLTGVETLVQSGLNLLIGSYGGNTSSRDQYLITTGQLGGVTRIDLHFFAYRFTSSQLTQICKQVISVAAVLSSVDISKLDDNTLRVIVQNCYGKCSADTQNKIYTQLQTAAKNSRNPNGSPTNKTLAEHFHRAFQRTAGVGATESRATVTFTAKTPIGEAKNTVSALQEYLRGGFVAHYNDLWAGMGWWQLSEVSVLCEVPYDSISDSDINGEVEVVATVEQDTTPYDLNLPLYIDVLLGKTSNDAVCNLPIDLYVVQQ